MRKPKKAVLPHCPGETQTPGVRSIIAMIPKLVGLKICFPFKRKTNLLVMVKMAASIANVV